MAGSNHSTHHTAEADILGGTPRDTVSCAADPEVRAAFLAFHREHITGGQAFASGGNRLGSGSWVFVGLGLLGLGGGLLLAAISFNNPESTSIAGTRPPEMIYLPPASDPKTTVTAEEGTVETAKPATDTMLARTETEDPASSKPVDHEGDAALANLDGWNVSLTSNPAFPDANTNFDVAMRYTAAGYALGSTKGDGTDAGYGAIELPSVPEPSTGAAACLGLALLIGVTHLKKRRT